MDKFTDTRRTTPLTQAQGVYQLKFVMPNTTAESTTFYVRDVKFKYDLNVVKTYELYRIHKNNTYITGMKWSDYAGSAEFRAPEGGDNRRFGFKSWYSFRTKKDWANAGTRFDIQTQNISLQGNNYLEFWIYSEKYVPYLVQFRMPKGDGSHNYFSSQLPELTPDKWNYVRVPINGVGTLDRIWIDYQDPGIDDSADTKAIYLSDIFIKQYEDMSLSAEFGTTEATCKQVTLNWNCGDTGVSGYNIYRNNELIKTLTGTTTKTYIDTEAVAVPTNMETISYRVEAVSLNKNTELYTPAETSLLYMPNQDNITNEYKLITGEPSGEYISNAKWSVYSWNGKNAAPEGDASRKGYWSYYSIKGATRSTGADLDYAASGDRLDFDVKNVTLKGENWLEFYIYSEKYVPKMVQFQVSNTYPGYNFAENGVTLKPDQWNFVRVPIEATGTLSKIWVVYDSAIEDANEGNKVYVSDMSVKKYENIVNINGTVTEVVEGSCKTGETLTITTNLLEGVTDKICIVGEYNSTGILENVEILTLEDGDNTHIVGSGAKSVRVFLWKNLPGTTPLAECRSITVTATE